MVYLDFKRVEVIIKIAIIPPGPAKQEMIYLFAHAAFNTSRCAVKQSQKM